MQKSFLAMALVALMAISAAVASTAAQAASNANAEPMDMDPSVLSKMALERAKQKQLTRNTDSGSSASTGLDQNNPQDCGSVNIGNILTGGRPGFQPREVTVVITGDVINANNKCK